MYSINRAVLFLIYKDSAIQWVNNFSSDLNMSKDDVNKDKTIYLIPENYAESPEKTRQWLKKNYSLLFETELLSWSLDSDTWPAKRDFKLFKQWFDIECHSVVADTVNKSIIKVDF